MSLVSQTNISTPLISIATTVLRAVKVVNSRLIQLVKSVLKLINLMRARSVYTVITSQDLPLIALESALNCAEMGSIMELMSEMTEIYSMAMGVLILARLSKDFYVRMVYAGKSSHLQRWSSPSLLRM